MAKNSTTLNTNLRNSILKDLIEFIATKYDTDAISVASGAVAIPVVDEEGNEKYAKIVVSIPRGTRDGQGGYKEYNAYDEQELYKYDQETKATNKAKREATKQAKIKADEERRATKKAMKNLEKAISES